MEHLLNLALFPFAIDSFLVLFPVCCSLVCGIFGILSCWLFGRS